jgi:hypothetical protein
MNIQYLNTESLFFFLSKRIQVIELSLAQNFSRDNTKVRGTDYRCDYGRSCLFAHEVIVKLQPKLLKIRDEIGSSGFLNDQYVWILDFDGLQNSSANCSVNYQLLEVHDDVIF